MAYLNKMNYIFPKRGLNIFITLNRNYSSRINNPSIVKAFEDEIENRIKRYGIDEVVKEGTVSYYKIKALENSKNIVSSYPKIIKSSDCLKNVKGIGPTSASIIDKVCKNKY